MILQSSPAGTATPDPPARAGARSPAGTATPDPPARAGARSPAGTATPDPPARAGYKTPREKLLVNAASRLPEPGRQPHARCGRLQQNAQQADGKDPLYPHKRDPLPDLGPSEARVHLSLGVGEAWGGAPEKRVVDPFWPTPSLPQSRGELHQPHVHQVATDVDHIRVGRVLCGQPTQRPEASKCHQSYLLNLLVMNRTGSVHNRGQSCDNTDFRTFAVKQNR